MLTMALVSFAFMAALALVLWGLQWAVVLVYYRLIDLVKKWRR
jgi:hypothetical protein